MEKVRCCGGVRRGEAEGPFKVVCVLSANDGWTTCCRLEATFGGGKKTFYTFKGFLQKCLIAPPQSRAWSIQWSKSKQQKATMFLWVISRFAVSSICFRQQSTWTWRSRLLRLHDGDLHFRLSDITVMKIWFPDLQGSTGTTGTTFLYHTDVVGRLWLFGPEGKLWLSSRKEWGFWWNIKKVNTKWGTRTSWLPQWLQLHLHVLAFTKETSCSVNASTTFGCLY